MRTFISLLAFAFLASACAGGQANQKASSSDAPQAEAPTCPICTETPIPGQNWADLPCGHGFHVSCLRC